MASNPPTDGAAPPANNPGPAVNPVPQRKPTTGFNLNLDFLSLGTSPLEFGRADAIYRVVTRVLDPNDQVRLPVATYNAMCASRATQAPITEVNFTRMWRTLVLKRLQDTHEQVYYVRPQNYIRLNRNIPVPAPLADLLYSIGYIRSANLGYKFICGLPSKPAANPPDWWDIDNAVVNGWLDMCEGSKTTFTFKEFPSPTSCEDRALVLTTRSDFAAVNDEAQVRSYSAEARPSDALIHLANDPLFSNPNQWTYDNSMFTLTALKDVRTTRAAYCASYVTGTNA